mmetsp:Transcript_49714/g.130765  ORF Transcript_49714/g.130765 Transcript_49714/m.130765 type:complete len:256 (+) Transcript_49714:705-1472(+)
MLLHFFVLTLVGAAGAAHFLAVVRCASVLALFNEGSPAFRRPMSHLLNGNLSFRHLHNVVQLSGIPNCLASLLAQCHGATTQAVGDFLFHPCFSLHRRLKTLSRINSVLNILGRLDCLHSNSLGCPLGRVVRIRNSLLRILRYPLGERWWRDNSFRNRRHLHKHVFSALYGLVILRPGSSFPSVAKVRKSHDDFGFSRRRLSPSDPILKRASKSSVDLCSTVNTVSCLLHFAVGICFIKFGVWIIVVLAQDLLLQ